jgi:hypothetical protein
MKDLLVSVIDGITGDRGLCETWPCKECEELAVSVGARVS